LKYALLQQQQQKSMNLSKCPYNICMACIYSIYYIQYKYVLLICTNACIAALQHCMQQQLLQPGKLRLCSSNDQLIADCNVALCSATHTFLLSLSLLRLFLAPTQSDYLCMPTSLQHWSN